LLLLPLVSFCQVSDSFNDGEFTTNPTWSGMDTNFIIDANLLRSNGPQASSLTYLSTPNTLIDSTEWSFLVRLDFNPSSTNLVRIYLVSDQADLSGSLNGYFLQLGESGTAPDSFDIFYQNGTTITKIFTGISGMMTSSTSNLVRVRILRLPGSTWEVFADKTGGTNYTAEGSFTHDSVTATSWFGVVCKYSTASRYNLYYFDDLSISKIIIDTIKPEVLSVNVVSGNAIDVIFSEPVELNSAEWLANYSVNSSIGNPYAANCDSSNPSVVHLVFASSFIAGIDYSLSISGVKDLAANAMSASILPFYVIGLQDIVINEILFNPKTGGYDFIELFNRSNHTIDLKHFAIVERDAEAPETILDQVTITTQSFLLYPKNYVVLSENIESIQQDYFVENPSALLQVSSLPNFPDDGGVCVLYSPYGSALDSLSFSNNWHFALLDLEGGVSLERIDFDKETQNKSNWHSAASTVGFATPTYENSQYATGGIANDEIKIDPEVFTPDSDGEKDFTSITYRFTEPGYIMNAKVYDVRGREIRTLISNELLSSDGAFRWDGIDDDNKKARIGIYLLYIEIFNLQGQVKKFKKQVVLGAKLN
jgi:hypothetical protein